MVYDHSFLCRLLRAVLRKEARKSGAQRTRSSMFRQIRGGCDYVSRPRGRRRYRQPGEFGSAAFVLPVEVLATIEGRTQERVSLDAFDPGRIAIPFC